MCPIEEISINDSARWNAIVKSTEKYDVFYLNEYVASFMNESPENGEAVLLVYKNGSDQAINVVFRRDVSAIPLFSTALSRNQYFDLSTPYGYGGFVGRVSNYKILNNAYDEYCRRLGYVCEFVRFELNEPYAAHYNGTVVSRTHNVIRELDSSLEDIWRDFKPKVRKNVNRAQKNALEIISENSGEYLSDFLDIYYSTMDRSNAQKNFYFSRSFFEKLNEMEGNVRYFHVLHEGKIISTELVIYGPEKCYSFLGGTYREYFDLRPNDFLKFEIIKWAKMTGLKAFVLGGGYGSDDGIFQYKSSFAPNGIVDFYIGSKIIDKEKYAFLVNLREGIDGPVDDINYFPRYRA